jgi:hypothetical protein
VTSPGVAGSPLHLHQAPSDCPVCGDRLQTTRLSCGSCGSELSGVFSGCAFCALGPADRALLEVFLVSRGNMREVERHLGVSYPTARQRFADVLGRLGLGDPAPPEPPAPAVDRDDVLRRLAAGELAVDEAERLLLG